MKATGIAIAAATAGCRGGLTGPGFGYGGEPWGAMGFGSDSGDDDRSYWQQGNFYYPYDRIAYMAWRGAGGDHEFVVANEDAQSIDVLELEYTSDNPLVQVALGEDPLRFSYDAETDTAIVVTTVPDEDGVATEADHVTFVSLQDATFTALSLEYDGRIHYAHDAVWGDSGTAWVAAYDLDVYDDWFLELDTDAMEVVDAYESDCYGTMVAYIDGYVFTPYERCPLPPTGQVVSSDRYFGYADSSFTNDIPVAPDGSVVAYAYGGFEGSGGAGEYLVEADEAGCDYVSTDGTLPEALRYNRAGDSLILLDRAYEYHRVQVFDRSTCELVTDGEVHIEAETFLDFDPEDPTFVVSGDDGYLYGYGHNRVHDVDNTAIFRGELP